MKKRPRNAAEIERDIRIALYWPGGAGGGGSRRAGKTASPVVRPHKRTSPLCRLCNQFHTVKEHDAHAEGGTAGMQPGKPRRKRPSPEPLAIVREAIRQIGPKGRYGRDNVFISALWRRVGSKLRMSLPEFKRWLIVQNREQNLSLTRADLVDDMDPKKVEDSEIYDLGATFHFVTDPEAVAAFGWTVSA